jgi:hypothetical protein
MAAPSPVLRIRRLQAAVDVHSEDVLALKVSGIKAALEAAIRVLKVLNMGD